MYAAVCSEDDVWEGGTWMVAAGNHRILLVWPRGGALSALQGICPHRGVPLDGASLVGQALTCPQHLWTFDAANGDALDPPGHALARYPLKRAGGEVLVDTAGIVPNTVRADGSG